MSIIFSLSSGVFCATVAGCVFKTDSAFAGAQAIIRTSAEEISANLDSAFLFMIIILGLNFIFDFQLADLNNDNILRL